jgi:probable selenium-dependent hydroxylase accessory protein YqeC
LKKKVKSLVEALGIRDREHVALVGGGGKTTLMFALAEELRRNGKRVITSTTTKVLHKEAMQYEKVLLVGDEVQWRNKTGEGLGREGTVFVGRSILDSGKVEGINPSLADEVYGDSEVYYLVVEADGSAGHPLKAPAEHEPVIPSSVTMVVAMMGLEAMGARLDEATAFRVEQVKNVTELHTGDILTPGALAKVFLHPAGVFKGTPEHARRVVFLNKADLIRDERNATELADILLADPLKAIDRVVIGSLKKGVYKIRAKRVPQKVVTPAPAKAEAGMPEKGVFRLFGRSPANKDKP